MSEPGSSLTVAFVLASYTPDAPAGMERATAALARGLREVGHRVLIITAAAIRAADEVEVLGSVKVAFPADDNELREAISDQDNNAADELRALYRRHEVDVAVYVDALWGLGRIAPRCEGVRSVLAMHVVGHHEDLVPALERADAVIAPSPAVLGQAHDRGYNSECWRVVPNALLVDPAAPDEARRQSLRQQGPVRVLARLGPEKNVQALLRAGGHVKRDVDVVLAEAGFEQTAGSQAAEFRECIRAAKELRACDIRDEPLPWDEAQPWLADAAVVIVPSTRETFGLVALEAMSVGTPVVAYGVGNLPSLVGTDTTAGGILVPRTHGEIGLWRAAERLLDDPLRYTQLSRAAYYRSRDYLPTTVAHEFLKAVR